MTFYICAFIFYMYVRIGYSLDLGPGYIWYGIYLLCVEVLGFTTTIIYGLNLLWNPVIEQFPEDPTSPGRPQVGFPLSVLYSLPFPIHSACSLLSSTEALAFHLDVQLGTCAASMCVLTYLQGQTPLLSLLPLLNQFSYLHMYQWHLDCVVGTDIDSSSGLFLLCHC